MPNLLPRLREDLLIILTLAMALFLALSLGTHSGLDPSFSTTGQGLQIRNACGLIGGFVSDLMYQLFGVTSWLVVGVLVWHAVGPIIGKKNSNNLGLGLLLLVIVPSLMGLHFPSSTILNGQMPMAGALGMGLSNLISKVLNKIGSAVFLWTVLLVLIVAMTQISILDMKGRVRSFIKPKLLALVQALRTQLVQLKQYMFPGSFRESRSSGVKMSMEKTLEGPRFLMRHLDLVQSSPAGEINTEGSEFANPSQEICKEALLPPIPSVGPRLLIEESFVTRKQRPDSVKSGRLIENWELPKLSILTDPPLSRIKIDERELRATTTVLEDKLAQFSIGGKVTAVRPGPAVTLFEFKPNADVRISRITELADDLALALSSESVRIIAPVPGRDVVGIETSNLQREKVYLKDNLTDPSFWDENIKLPIVLGKQANGVPKVVDLRKMPHLLVAGTTGSGKSVFVVSVLTSLLFRHSPKTLRLILVDPKQVDLGAFQNLPHLLMPLVTDPRKAVNALKWAIQEMEKRYRSMSKFGARGLEDFNRIVSELTKTQLGEHETINAEYELGAISKTYYHAPQPYIVIIVEEFADLMAVDKVNVEHSVVRLAQMARACGIHLILAMQSPRRDVVTGLIKTNIPGRISFKVASKVDSRVILDDSGAERLLANGDMLFHAPGVSRPERHHGPWLTEVEIDKLSQYWSSQGEPDFDHTVIKVVEGEEVEGGPDSDENAPESEERYDEILDYVAQLKEVSASLLQRKFRLGYPRAARMIEIFEKEGVVGPANGSKPRQVLVYKGP